MADGEPVWWRHVTGVAVGEGMFDYWTVHAARDPALEASCGAWIRKNLVGYTGLLNLETIGGTIIEAHLRLSDQWPDLYGAGWVDAFVGLYRDRCLALPRRRSPRRVQPGAVRAAWPALSQAAGGAR